jgi:hypothetical protein
MGFVDITYFNCTGYRDRLIRIDSKHRVESNPIRGVLTRALGKEVLSFGDCLQLIFDCLFFGLDVQACDRISY